MACEQRSERRSKNLVGEYFAFCFKSCGREDCFFVASTKFDEDPPPVYEPCKRRVARRRERCCRLLW